LSQSSNEIIHEYFDDPAEYHYQEQFRPDEEALFRCTAHLMRKFLDTRVEAKVLDLCSGTGLSLERVASHPFISEAVGIDIDPRYVRFASERFKGIFPKVRFQIGDAVNPCIAENMWDLIILLSAYHHIEDGSKIRFLAKVRDLMKTDSLAIIGENVIPDYQTDDMAARKRSIKDFYSAVLRDIRERFDIIPSAVEDSIRQIVNYGQDGKFEYKVPLKQIIHDINSVGLKIIEMRRVWPINFRDLPPNTGNFVFLLQK
jgi:SAM-dependent methyltransferase